MGRNKKQKEQKQYKLLLTAVQLEHVRDVLSVVLNPSTGLTVSEHIAKFNKRSRDENDLWDIIVDACERAKVPRGNDAPDYVIAVVPPEVGIIKIDPNTEDEQESSVEEKGLFSIKEE